MNVIRRLFKTVRTRVAPELPFIALDRDGFTVGSDSMAWSDIRKIAAFKHDVLATDDVWFEFWKDGQVVRVCEEQAGFQELLGAVIARFPSVSGWEEQVVLPAFAENYRALYVRS